jgi:hypothetical protein
MDTLKVPGGIPAGNVATICVLLNELTETLVPLKLRVGPVFEGSNPDPVMVTWLVE